MADHSRQVDYGLAGKTALVTGASRRIGIGAATALALAKAGAKVFTTYYRPFDARMPWGSEPDDALRILDAIRAEGVMADGMEADLADPHTPARLFDAAEKSVGPVDILINNAAYSVNASIDTLTAASLDAHYAVNVRGTALMCAEFASRHDGRAGRRIINLTSGQGYAPMPEELPYAITKGAVEALTTSLSASLIKRGITVNAVDPGATDTGWMSAALQTQLEANAPAGRVGTPDDAARIILFLASAQAGWITGQIIRSRGGA
jgi:3-oxoacyl-[acyl-carrier protein] reductase